MPLEPERQIIDITAKELLAISHESRQRFIDEAFTYWREKGFPYRQMSDMEINKNFKKLSETDTRTFFSNGKIIGSTVCLDLVNSFYPQIWSAARWGHLKSPIDHFYDDDTLKKLLERAIGLWPDRKCWCDYVVRSMFRIYSGGRVSNFRPTIAKAVIENFSENGSRVLDFCSGFGGRLLGTMSLDRHYVGIDPSVLHVNSNIQMFNAVGNEANCTVEFLQDCAEEAMPKLHSGSFDLIFTSPPYFRQEKYTKDSNQSYLRYQNYDIWKKEFLTRVVEESARLLTTNGYFVLNISDVRGYRLARDFEELASKYFKLQKKYELEMTARPLHRKNGIAHKSEPLFVYQKK